MKVMRLSDVYIRVDITEGWFVKDEQDSLKKKLSDAGDIKSAIKRHVDGVSRVDIVEEFAGVCGFCGYSWTEDSETYNGGCCDKDEANNPNPGE